jgi:hypothetical protein
MTGEYINCPLTVIKSGRSEFSYKATVDFGDGFVQSITIDKSNSSDNQPSFIALFSHRYSEPGFYSINFSINALKINWTVEENLQIFGMY